VQPFKPSLKLIALITVIAFSWTSTIAYSDVPLVIETLQKNPALTRAKAAMDTFAVRSELRELLGLQRKLSTDTAISNRRYALSGKETDLNAYPLVLDAQNRAELRKRQLKNPNQEDIRIIEEILKPLDDALSSFSKDDGSSAQAVVVPNARFLVDFFKWRARKLGFKSVAAYKEYLVHFLENEPHDLRRREAREIKYVLNRLFYPQDTQYTVSQNMYNAEADVFMGQWMNLLEEKKQRGESSLIVRIVGVGRGPKRDSQDFELRQIYKMWNRLNQRVPALKDWDIQFHVYDVNGIFLSHVERWLKRYRRFKQLVKLHWLDFLDPEQVLGQWDETPADLIVIRGVFYGLPSYSYLISDSRIIRPGGLLITDQYTGAMLMGTEETWHTDTGARWTEKNGAFDRVYGDPSMLHTHDEFAIWILRRKETVSEIPRSESRGLLGLKEESMVSSTQFQADPRHKALASPSGQVRRAFWRTSSGGDARSPVSASRAELRREDSRKNKSKTLQFVSGVLLYGLFGVTLFLSVGMIWTIVQSLPDMIRYGKLIDQLTAEGRTIPYYLFSFGFFTGFGLLANFLREPLQAKWIVFTNRLRPSKTVLKSTHPKQTLYLRGKGLFGLKAVEVSLSGREKLILYPERKGEGVAAELVTKVENPAKHDYYLEPKASRYLSSDRNAILLRWNPLTETTEFVTAGEPEDVSNGVTFLKIHMPQSRTIELELTDKERSVSLAFEYFFAVINHLETFHRMMFAFVIGYSSVLGLLMLLLLRDVEAAILLFATVSLSGLIYEFLLTQFASRGLPFVWRWIQKWHRQLLNHTKKVTPNLTDRYLRDKHHPFSLSRDQDLTPYHQRSEAIHKIILELSKARIRAPFASDDVLTVLHRLARTVTDDKNLNRAIENELVDWVSESHDLRAVASVIAGWTQAEGSRSLKLDQALQQRWQLDKQDVRALKQLGSQVPSDIRYELTEPETDLPPVMPPAYEDQIRERNVYGLMGGEEIENIARRARSIDPKQLTLFLKEQLQKAFPGDASQVRIRSVIGFGSYLYGVRLDPTDLDLLVVVDHVSDSELPKPIKLTVTEVPRQVFRGERARYTSAMDIQFMTHENLMRTTKSSTLVANSGIVLRNDEIMSDGQTPILIDEPLSSARASDVNRVVWAADALSDARQMIIKELRWTTRYDDPVPVFRAKASRRLDEANLYLMKADSSVAVPLQEMKDLRFKFVMYLEGHRKHDVFQNDLRVMRERLYTSLLRARAALIWRQLKTLQTLPTDGNQSGKTSSELRQNSQPLIGDPQPQSPSTADNGPSTNRSELRFRELSDISQHPHLQQFFTVLGPGVLVTPTELLIAFQQALEGVKPIINEEEITPERYWHILTILEDLAQSNPDGRAAELYELLLPNDETAKQIRRELNIFLNELGNYTLLPEELMLKDAADAVWYLALAAWQQNVSRMQDAKDGKLEILSKAILESIPYFVPIIAPLLRGADPQSLDFWMPLAFPFNWPFEERDALEKLQKALLNVRQTEPKQLAKASTLLEFVRSRQAEFPDLDLSSTIKLLEADPDASVLDLWMELMYGTFVPTASQMFHELKNNFLAAYGPYLDQAKGRRQRFERWFQKAEGNIKSFSQY